MNNNRTIQTNSGLRLERERSNQRTFDVIRDGVWQARIVVDPLVGIIVRAGGLTATDKREISTLNDFPFMSGS